MLAPQSPRGAPRLVEPLLVEDDYDGEFRFDRQAIGALQGIAHDSTVYVGSTSKAHAPGLRLGWFARPPKLVEPLAEGKFLADHGSSVLDQLALLELISRGAYDRHVRQCRTRLPCPMRGTRGCDHRSQRAPAVGRRTRRSADPRHLARCARH